MATRSFIGIFNQMDGSVRGIYCHNDGYPEHVGDMLSQHYKSAAKVNSLLALGDISSLGKTLNSTVAYHRDRGESKNENVTYSNIESMCKNVYEDMCAEYSYILMRDGWHVYKH